MAVWRNARGFTLPELLVAIAVLALVLAAVTTIHQSVLQAYVIGSNKTEVQQNVRVALDRMGRTIRETRTALTLAALTSLTVVDQDTGLPVTYSLNANTLIRATNGADEILLARVQDLAFTYFDSSNIELAAPVGTPANVFRVQIAIQTASEDNVVTGGAADSK